MPPTKCSQKYCYEKQRGSLFNLISTAQTGSHSITDYSSIFSSTSGVPGGRTSELMCNVFWQCGIVVAVYFCMTVLLRFVEVNFFALPEPDDGQRCLPLISNRYFAASFVRSNERRPITASWRTSGRKSGQAVVFLRSFHGKLSLYATLYVVTGFKLASTSVFVLFSCNINFLNFH